MMKILISSTAEHEFGIKEERGGDQVIYSWHERTSVKGSNEMKNDKL